MQILLQLGATIVEIPRIWHDKSLEHLHFGATNTIFQFDAQRLMHLCIEFVFWQDSTHIIALQFGWLGDFFHFSFDLFNIRNDLWLD